MNSIIHFGNGFPTLLDYGKLPWNLNSKYSIEFYPDFVISVLLISTNDLHLQDNLNNIENGEEPIALDLEWEDEICLFQFCSSKGCLIIRHPCGQGNPILRSFLETHSFYGKGNHNDLQKLTEKFGLTFKIDLEDIERTRLIPNSCSINFIQMSEQFAGQSTAVFKDKEMTFSNWEDETLSMRQVMYAAFDVVALFKCYPNFPPASTNVKITQVKKKGPKGKKCINVDQVFRRKYPIVNPNSIDTSHHLFCYILHNYEGTKNINEIRNNIINICDFTDDSLIDYISLVHNEKSGFVDVCISLFIEIDESIINSNSLFSCQNVLVVPDVDPLVTDLLTNEDVFFLNNIPDYLLNNESLRDFLFNFGTDFDFTLDEHFKYATVSPRNPYSSLKLKRFLPFISEISIHDFPDFLPILTVYSNTKLTDSEIVDFMNILVERKESVTVKDVSKLSGSFEYNVTFSSNIEKEKTFEKCIKKVENGKEITVVPFVPNDQIKKLMDSYQIIIKNCSIENSDVYNIFNKYGKLFQIKRDEILNILYVQFRSKIDAYRCIPCLKNEGFVDACIKNGTSVILRNLPENITEREIFEVCKKTGEVIEIMMNDKRYVKITFGSYLYAIDSRDKFKRTIIRGKQIQADLISNSQQVETPFWKIQQIMNWVKIKTLNEEDINGIYMRAVEFGKVVDFRLKDDYVYIIFTSEDSANNMKNIIKEAEQCDNETFTLFLNKPLQINEVKEKVNDLPSYFNRKVFILDPKPDCLTDEILAEKAFNWRHLISGAHNVDSIAHEGMKRTIFYSGGKKRDQQIIDLISNLGIELGDEEKWRPVVLTYASAHKLLGVPPPPMKKARRWVIIDPLPEKMTEKMIRDICSEFEPFDVMYQNSSIEKGKERAVILKEPHAREVYWKLIGMEFNGEKINVTKLAPEHAPIPL